MNTTNWTQRAIAAVKTQLEIATHHERTAEQARRDADRTSVYERAGARRAAWRSRRARCERALTRLERRLRYLGVE